MGLELDSISFEYRLNISGLSVKVLDIGFIGIGSKIQYRSGSSVDRGSPTFCNQGLLLGTD